MPDDDKKAPLDDIRTVVQMRGLCLERLEFKIYNMLKEHFEQIGDEKEIRTREILQVEANKAGRRSNLRNDRLMTVKASDGLKEFELRRKTQMTTNLDFDKLQKMEDETIGVNA